MLSSGHRAITQTILFDPLEPKPTREADAHVRDDPIKAKRQNNCLAIARNAYMSLDPKITAHNWNLAAIGVSDEAFSALVKANLGQGACSYVVLTPSEEVYNEISATLVHHGYNVSAYDLTEDVRPGRDLPSDLLTRSEATAIFFLFDLQDPASRTRAGSLAEQTLRDLYRVRIRRPGPGRPHHIQFFLPGMDRLPSIPDLPRALVTGRSNSIGIAFSCSDRDSLRRVYPGVVGELLDSCDTHLLCGAAQAGFKPSLWDRLAARFRIPARTNHCELHVRGLVPRRVNPFERSDRA